MVAKRKAKLFFVRVQTLSFSRQRAGQFKADLHPDETIRDGSYWYTPRLRVKMLQDRNGWRSCGSSGIPTRRRARHATRLTGHVEGVQTSQR